jgi:molybdopterin-guanine dinucleotide biosynthesis protein A
LLDTSAIILANEPVKGFSKDKGTMLIDNKALIRHAFDAVNPIVDEIIIVTNTQERIDEYTKLLPKTAKFVTDNKQQQWLNLLNENVEERETVYPKALNMQKHNYQLLSGAITGFEAAQGKYALLLSYDAPFINKELAAFLLDIVIGKMAAVPRTPDNEIEPLCSAYQTKTVLEIAKQTVDEEATLDLYAIIEKLRGVRYISMSVIEQIDPGMKSFFRINTPLDLKRATVMLQGKQKLSKQRK